VNESGVYEWRLPEAISGFLNCGRETGVIQIGVRRRLLTM
jgi:hypothetical protein